VAYFLLGHTVVAEQQKAITGRFQKWHIFRTP